MVAYGISVTVVGPCVTSLEATFEVSHATVGWMFSAGSLGYLIGVRVGSALTGPLGLAWTLRIGVIGLSAGLFIVCATPIWAFCLAGHCLAGISGGVIEPAMVASIQSLYGDKRRRALNLSQVGFGFGAIVGPYLVRTALSADWGWRVAFGASAGLTFAMLSLFPRQPIPSDDGIEAGDASSSNGTKPTRNPVLWLMSLSLFFYVGGELGLTAWAAAYFEKVRGVSRANASFAPLALWVGLLLGRMAMWVVSDRHSSRLVLLICSVSSVFFAAGALMCSEMWAACLMLTASGLGLGPIWPTVLDHSADRLRSRSVTVISWVIVGGGVGAFSQGGLGFVAEQWSLTAAMIVAIVLLVGVTVCFVIDWFIEEKWE